MEFKDRIKSLRLAKGLTQDDLAEVLNYGRTAIANYEAGRSEPAYTDLLRISNYFSCSIDYLLGKTDKVSNDTPVSSVEVMNTVYNKLLEKGIIKQGEEIDENKMKEIAELLGKSIDIYTILNPKEEKGGKTNLSVG